MALLGRYIVKQIIVGYVIVLMALLTLIWLTQSLHMIDFVVSQGASLWIFLQMSVWILPNFIQILSPLAFFAVVLFVLARMQSDKELMVVQAAGTSPYQIMKPVLFLGIVLVIMGYFLSFFLIPYSNQRLNEIKFQIRNKISHILLQEGQFNNLKKDVTVYVKERADGGVLRDVLVHEKQKDGTTNTMIAKEGVVFNDSDGLKVQLKGGSRQTWDAVKKRFSILKFQDYVMAFDNRNSANREQKAKEFSSWFLLTASREQAGDDTVFRRFKLEIAKRLILPLYHLSLMFLALFGIFSGFYNRRGQSGRINLVVGLALLFQAMGLLFENLSGKNLWFIALMVVNMLLPIVWIYAKVIREKVSYVAVLLLGLCLAGNAMGATPHLSVPNVDKNAPVDFESDFVSYDKKTDTMKAWGNVVISQNDLTIQTAELLYHRKENQIELPQKSTITSGDTITHMDSAVLQGDLKKAVGKGIEVFLADHTVMKAQRLKRTGDGKLLYLSDLSYTPCEVCADKPPFWQLTAKKMKQNSEDKTMQFYHTFFEVKDVPVFYFPYFRMPDLSVKRKTGFLIPSLSHSSNLGTGIEAPFFVDIADNQNLLLRPILTTDHTPLGMLDYNGIFKNAKVRFQASGTQDDHSNAEGHVKLNGEYILSDHIKIDGQLFRVSNDTYFRRYPIPNVDDKQSFLTSHLTGTYLGDQSYGTLKLLSFQSLQTGVRDSTLPKGLPVGNFHYQTDPLNAAGLYAFSDVNMALLQTGEDFRSDRLSYTQGVHLPAILSSGLLLDTIATVRADGYAVDTGRAAGYAKQDDTYGTGRIYPNVSVEASYPMAYTTLNTTQVFEPILMGVWSTASDTNASKIPNLDSIDFDFDDTNLFARNRFSGYDRVETGTRLNYGMKWALYDTSNRSITTLFGQSYRVDDKDDILANLMGYQNHFSDYVGRIQADYKDLSLAYRFRLASDDLAVQKNEVTLSGGKDILRLGVDYAYIKEINSAVVQYPTREEVLLFGSSKLSPAWSVSGYYRYDVQEKQTVETGGMIRWENDCTAVVFDASRSFTKDRNYSGNTSFKIKLILKTLGDL